MKKILLFLSFVTSISAFGQIEIRKYNTTENIIGQTLSVNIDLIDSPVGTEGFVEPIKLYVKNTTSEGIKVAIKREILDGPSEWMDNICWPPQCFTINQGVNSYTTPNTVGSPAPLILANSEMTTTMNMEAEIKPQYMVGLSTPGSVGNYKYTVVNADNGDELGSVTVTVNYVNNLSVATTKTVELTVGPNPANDYVAINAEGLTGGYLKVVDMLGNVIYTSEFNNAKKLNVSEFKNGMYLLSVTGEGSKGFTKKLIVKH